MAKEVNLTTFVWMGDTVYVKDGHNLESLRKAYQDEALTSPTSSYQKFVSTLHHNPIGVYDDHDFGANDAGGGEGSFWLDRESRKNIFLDFLQVSETSVRRQRPGVYHTHRYNSPTNPEQKIRFILLDTRFDRSNHVIPSVASYNLRFSLLSKIASFVALGTRLISAYTGLTLVGDENRTILSDTQWEWFQEELAGEEADLTVIVSSIQILTSNPFVESWGHFPSEKNQLLEIVRDYELSTQRSVLFLSGDIHLGEFLAVENHQIAEVTSSGLTHTCTDGMIPYSVCKAIVSFWHRPNLDQNFYIGKNYGVLTVNFENRTFQVHVKDEFGKSQLQIERHLDHEPILPTDLTLVPGIIPDLQTQHSVIVCLIVCLFGFVSLIYWLFKRFCCGSFPKPKTD